MIVYADVLVIVNFLVDYFLLLATAKVLKRKFTLFRIIISAFIGGISSLYIFLPNQNAIVQFLFITFISALMVLIGFKFYNLKFFLKDIGVLMIITLFYKGIISAFWNIFKPDSIIINNSVIYFDISPIVLCVTTVVLYFLLIILKKIFKGSSVLSQKCKITVSAGSVDTEFSAILDSGNSIEDIFTNSEIIIADKSVLLKLLGENYEKREDLKKRYRAIPCATVSGTDVLNAYRCDSAEIVAENKKVILEKPILAEAKYRLNDGYEGIVNPKIFANQG